MSTLYLVRHAQASFLSDDYDQLSEHGHEQARRLGAYWAAARLAFDRVLVGPRKRHRQTAEIVCESLRAASVPVPSPSVLEELDEYPADQVLLAILPQLTQENRELSRLAEAARAADDKRERGRALDQLLMRALHIWTEAADAAAEHESWAAFVERVERALAHARSVEGRGRRVLVVSSAGTIGAIVGRVLGTSARVTLELGWSLNNASLTELVFSGDRIGLSRFNTLPHLPEASSWTRR